MLQIDQRGWLADKADSLGLNCTTDGIFLAGVPLLRKAITGLAPRPSHELSALMEAAYDRQIEPTYVTQGLEVVARALDQGDLGRAMVAALRLRLPELSGEGAIGIAQVDAALAKYSPDEPRDERGRWTANGGGGRTNMAPPRSARVQGHHEPPTHARPQAQGRPVASPAGGGARLIPVANFRGANDNLAENVCWAASRQCQISALKDKGRTPYFAACQKAEDTCLLILPVSRLKPDQQIGVIFPDRTVVMIEDGTAMLNHLGGVRLKNPLR